MTNNFTILALLPRCLSSNTFRKCPDIPGHPILPWLRGHQPEIHPHRQGPGCSGRYVVGRLDTGKKKLEKAWNRFPGCLMNMMVLIFLIALI